MKTIFALPLLTAGLLIQAAYAGDRTDVHQQLAFSVQQKNCVQINSRSFHAAGTVRKIDVENGIVTIFHSPVADLMWPAMTMPFAVEDKALLESVKVGDVVKFEFVRDARNGVIVGIR